MAERKLFAGHMVRRLRRNKGLTQLSLAQALSISPSYLNLIERNQRPLTASLMLALAAQFDLDTRAFVADEPAGGAEGLRRRLADPLFADLDIDRNEIGEWLAAAPGGAEAFARAFDRIGKGSATASDPIADVRAEIERWRNYYAELDSKAEVLADELRMVAGDAYAAMAERLRARHNIAVRILPVEAMPDALRRLDLHARQLQLSELLDSASRTFGVAFQLAQLEARDEIDALARGGGFADRAAERLYRRHLTGYFAAALMMPYSRFMRACESTGYDIELLQRRFGAGFEQVAHRLTTLHRVGARGLPFFMLRIDRAGQASKLYVGASASPLARSEGRCPLWNLHEAFAARGSLVRQIVELEDGTRWFTLARTVRPQGNRLGGISAEFAIGLGLRAELATPLAAARGIAIDGDATPIGLGCVRCTRFACPQRASAPAGRAPLFDDREQGLTPFAFARD